MTITSETCEITDVGDGSNTEFAYNFLIPYQPDGVTPAVGAYVLDGAVRTNLVLDTDYSITGVGNPAGGIVTYPLSGTPLGVGDTIVIGRTADYEQPYDFPQQSFRPTSVEQAMDWAMMTIQQLNNRVAALEEVLSVEPLPFEFAPVFDAELDTDIEGTEITFEGHSDGAFLISAVDLEYSLDGGEFTTESGMARRGSKLKPRLHSAVIEATVTEGSLTAGDHTAVFSVTTAAEEPPEPPPIDPTDWPTVDATPGTFAAVLAAAAAGTIINLQTGTYNALTISAVNKAAPGVLIRPGPGQSPVVTGWSIFNSSGIWLAHFTGANKIYGPATKYLTWVRGCARIAVSDCELMGEVVEQIGLNNSWQGILATDGTDYSFTDLIIHDCRIGIGTGRIVGLTVDNNDFYRCAGDFIRNTAIQNFTIIGNTATDNYRWGTGHNDFIQLYTTSGPNKNGEIRDNIFRRGAGYAVQGIFARGSATAGYENITIERNGMVGAHQYNGIAMGFCNNYSVVNNFVQAYATGDHTMTRISVNDCTGVGLISENITTSTAITSARCVPAPAYGVGPTDDNTYNFPKATPGDYSALDTWIAGWEP